MDAPINEFYLVLTDISYQQLHWFIKWWHEWFAEWHDWNLKRKVDNHETWVTSQSANASTFFAHFYDWLLYWDNSIKTKDSPWYKCWQGGGFLLNTCGWDTSAWGPSSWTWRGWQHHLRRGGWKLGVFPRYPSFRREQPWIPDLRCDPGSHQGGWRHRYQQTTAWSAMKKIEKF